MPRIPLEFPLGGLNDSQAFSKQPYRTTREAVNVRGVDPITGRMCGAQRAGIDRHVTGNPQVNGSNKVQCLASITYDNRKVTYANLTPTYADLASVLTPNKADAPAVSVDSLSNVYIVDGLAGLAKYNSGLVLQWKVTIPAQDDEHAVRALAVSDSGLVFAGVSSGGEQEKTRLWCYEQLEDNKTNLLWEIEPGAYVEQIVIFDEKLYTIQNDTENNEAGLVVYDGIGTINPTVTLRRPLSAPLNGLAVGKDGSIYFCSPANASRGINTKYPGFSARTADQDMWNPRDLTDFNKRIWSWYDAQAISGFEDNDPIPVWDDLSGHGREWKVDQGLDSDFNKTWPTYQKTGIGTLPSVRFSNIISGATMRFVTGQNGSLLKGYADQQKTAWPGFPGGKFALFFVARFAPESQRRCMISQNSVSSDQDNNRFNVNNAWDGSDSVLDAGRAIWVASTLAGGIGAGGSAGSGNGKMCDLDWSYGASETVATLITIIHDAGTNPSTNVAQHMTVRVNGRPADRGLAEEIGDLVHTMLGGRDFGSSSHLPFQGDLAEMLVLGPYAAGTASTDPVSGNTDNGGTAKFYPRSIATTVAGSATASWVSTATNHFNDSEIERIEGYLAHRWGMSHLLPTGTAGVLLFEGGTPNPGNGSTVTIASTVYTFKTAAPSAAYEVQIGADAVTSMRALVRAINLTGVAGTDYGIGTAEHPTARVAWMNTVSTTNCNMKVESKGPSTTGLATTLTAGGGWTGAWTAATTSQMLATRLVGATSYYPGHYPHPFFLDFGAPRKSIAKLTVLPYSSGTGALPLVGQQITGGTSGAKGRLKEIRWGGTASSGTLVLADVSGTFQAAETITAPNTLTATSGTPQVDGPAFESEPLLLNSINPLLGKLDQNGALKWVLTSRLVRAWDGGTFPAVEVGGVGLAVAVAPDPVILATLTYSGGSGSAPSVGLAVTGATSGAAGIVSVVLAGATAGAGTIVVRSTGWKDLVEGEVISGGSWSAATIAAGTLTVTSHQAVYSYGPRFDSSSGEKTYHLRRVIDGGDGYSVQGADGAWGITNGTLAGAGTPDDADYTYPRLGVDSYGNVYLPYFEINGSTQRSMVAVSKNGTVLFQLNTTTNTGNLPAGLAVAADPAVPRYSPATPLSRAEFVYLVTNRGGISPVIDTNTLYKVPLLTVGKTTGSPRSVKSLAIAGGSFKWFDSSAITAPAGPKTLASPQLTSTADYICATSLFGEIFATDGKSVRVANPVDDTVLDYKPKKGKMPARFALLTHWRGRLTFGRGADSANNWAMLRQGDPYDADTGPAVVDPQQAVIGSDSRIGECPDIINFMAPLMDDFLIVGGDHTIQRMTGDPMAGGEFDLISDITGGAFGQQAWCKDPNGVAYFAGSRGGIFRLAPPYTLPERLTQMTIEQRLLDVDMSDFYFVLAWNARDDGLHVIQCPYGAGGTIVSNYFWEQRTGAWWEDQLAEPTLQPTAVYVLDGDAPGDRVLLFGCEDGRLRHWSGDALEDDGYAIDSRVLFGPVLPEEADFEARFTQLQVNLSDRHQGCNWEMLSSQSADVLGISKANGTLLPGRNEIINARIRGSALWVRLRMAQRNSRWAFESGSVNVAAAGRKRVRM